MTSDWPDGWILALLKDAGLPVTDFTKRAILAWQASTPMLPYTNNPLGMPAIKGKTLELMRTGYAMFVTMGDFRKAFADLIASPTGQPLHDALALNEQYSRVWRAVNSLHWPADRTETDYPSAVLDLTSERYRQHVATVADASDRKTSGAYGTQTAFGQASGMAARAGASTANALQQAMNVIQQIPGRMR